MPSPWDKVTRWAGIGNNREDAENGKSGDAMPDTQTHEAEFEPTETPLEAGTEMHADGAPGAETGTEKLELALAQMKAERDAMQDRWARLQAEFDNARKREAKERQDAREYTIGSAVEPFLGVMDNFGLALKAQGSAEQLRGGVELILKQMEEALRGLQVTAVETVGTQFDPRVHEALGSVETAEHPDHQVVEEIRKGYKIRERLLRPAMVKIAVNPSQVEA